MSKTLQVLITDDDPDICTLLKSFLETHDMEVDTALDGTSALSKLRKKKYDVTLCDFRLPDKDGYEMLSSIKEISPATQIIIITGYSDVKIAVKAMRMGAFEYVTKPIYPDEIVLSIQNAVESKQQLPAKKRPSLTSPEFQFIQGKSEKSRQLDKLIDLVAPTQLTCLITGESGTGKEFVAKKLHFQSERANKPFVALDCGAIPSDIATSELFGHVKGSFTGALKDKKGYFEMAHGGTLFLDEVGNLSYDNQVRLLRVLQERVIRPVGGSKDINVDVRILAATNEHLPSVVANGSFREDLYHRLNEFEIHVSPLRERLVDIPLFAEHFLKLAGEKLNKSLDHISDKAIDVLKTHYWPGNLRELQNVIRKASLMETETYLTANNLPQELSQPMRSNEDPLEDFELGQITDLKSLVESVEKKAILNALNRTNFNKSKTAELLDVDRKTLYNKIKAYEIKL